MSLLLVALYILLFFRIDFVICLSFFLFYVFVGGSSLSVCLFVVPFFVVCSCCSLLGLLMFSCVSLRAFCGSLSLRVASGLLLLVCSCCSLLVFVCWLLVV